MSYGSFHIGLVMVVGLMCSMPVQARASDGQIMSHAEFYATLDLSYPGLEPVVKALADGDTLAANEALLAHYVNRSSVQYFPLPSGGDVSRADDNLDRYFTVVGIRLKAEREDGGIDWQKTYAADREWHWQFHRMTWLRNLARVYGRTGDPKYAVGWAEHMVDWALNNEHGYPRTLDTGNRLRQWVESYQYVIHEYRSDAISADQHLIILKSMIQQVRFLRDNWRSVGNWGASETRGMGAVVAMFPEFRFEEFSTRQEWIDRVLFRIQHHLEGDFLDDGVQFEVSPMYHALAYRNLLVNYQLLEMNGIPAPEELVQAFLRPAEFLMHVNKPDGNFMQAGDSDEAGYLMEYVQIAGEIFDRDDMVYAATGGAEGSPPRGTFRLFQDGGFAFMRSDWGTTPTEYRNSKFLALTYGSNAPWHAHYDILGIEIYAYGRTLVKDPGRYTYSNDQGWRDHFKDTSAHNTVTVDGRNQRDQARGYVTGTEGAGFAYLDGYHDAYDGIRHRRKILFVRPGYWVISDLLTGEGERTFDLNFQLEALYRNRTTVDDESQAVQTRDFIIFPGHQRATPSVELQWVSHEYGEKRAAPRVTFSKQDQPPVTFETVFFPFNGSAGPRDVARIALTDAANSPVSDEEAVGLSVSFPDFDDAVLFAHESRQFYQTEHAGFDGDALYYRSDKHGSPADFSLIEGSVFEFSGSVLVKIQGDAATVSKKGHVITVEGDGFSEVRAWGPDVQLVLWNGHPVAFDRDGDFVVMRPAGVFAEQPGDPASSLVLKQNYPNPFAGETTIAYRIGEPATVSLEIFDIWGRRIATVLDAEQAPGFYRARFTAGELAPGVYFYRLAAGAEALTRPMTVYR